MGSERKCFTTRYETVGCLLVDGFCFQARKMKLVHLCVNLKFDESENMKSLDPIYPSVSDWCA